MTNDELKKNWKRIKDQIQKTWTDNFQEGERSAPHDHGEELIPFLEEDLGDSKEDLQKCFNIFRLKDLKEEEGFALCFRR